ncbi:MAG: hypothetical protein M5U26_28225 [Planctomycetota bacterium]|nr:hypothetical protein [Planctomycetota bacterium]
MEQQEIEIRGKIADLADGRAVLALGPPGTFLDEEIDPPWILVLEHKAVNALEPLFREYWDLEGDPPDQPKQIGNYAVLEHAAGSQSLYLPNASIFAAGASGMDVLLKGMEEAPKPSLEPEILAARELLPESDLALILRRDGMDKLAEGVPDLAVFDVPATLDALGWAPGSRALGAFKLTPKGLEERYLANFTDAAGLVPILAALPVAEAPAAGAPLALDAIPPHAALWVSCRGQLAPQAKAVAVALRKLDLALTVGALGPPPPNPANPQQPQLPGAGIVSRIDELERAMGKLEALLEQVQGGIELGVLVKAVGEELPADPPLALVLSAVLKDAAAVQGALERLTKADVTTWEKAEVGGGAHYRLLGYDEPPGVWIKDNRLIYASEPAVLSLALAALQHAKGNERLADRADVQAWLKDEALSPKCALRILGDAGQFLEMPYGLWHNLYSDFNEANPWPAFPAVLRPHLGRFRVELTPGAKADEVEVRAFSPVPLAAMVYVVFKPFVDLGW